MLAHFEYMHRDISTVILGMSNTQRTVSINISLQYYKLQSSKHAVVSIILVERTSLELIPLLLNMALLPGLAYTRSEFFLNNHQWLVIWLSSLHLFPYKFSMTLKSYGLPRYAFYQQCSPVSLHEYRKKFNSLPPLEDARAMLLNIKSMEKLLQTESGLYIEVNSEYSTT
uniref:Uncharacterized protein n=1 Tax=Rhodnius prolixus TaxID=13249 RepID=T1HTH8_RHOPR